MISQDIPKSDERAVETGQLSRAAQPHLPKAETTGYFEPHQMAKLAESGRLYVVADSVGEAASGQLAAQYAVKKILRSFYTHESPDLQARLLEAMQQANKDILDRNKEYPERRPLATYVTAVLIHDNKLLAANAGDGQVYVVWEEDIERLTSASNQAGEKSVKDKPPDADRAKPEAKTAVHPRPEKRPAPTEPPASPGASPSEDKSPLALGLAETVHIETFSRRLFAADTVVICSGGLTGYVSEKEIAAAISLHAPNQAIEQLMALAAERGNRGHLALSVTRVLSSPAAAHSPMPMVMPTPPKWSDWEISSKPQTRPMSKPIPATPSAATIATRPMSGPKRKSKPVEIPLKASSRRWPWRGCLAGVVVLAVLCALPFLIWRFLLPPNVLASVPFLGQVNITVREQAEAIGFELSETEEAASGPSGGGTPDLAPVEAAAATSPAEAPADVVAQGNSPLPTPTTAPAAVLTPTIAATPTPALPTPTATPTVAPTIAVPANCENRARFVTDVTVEDGTEFPPQREFEKIWQLRNEGTCPWGPGYTIRYSSGDFFGTDQDIPLVEVIAPDEEGNISASMIAPAEPGSYRGVWQLHDLTGEPFGPTMYLEIEVVPGAATDLETAPTGAETLYDFVANADQATWSTELIGYTVRETIISDQLELPAPDGLVAVGVAELRGNTQSDGPALLTYPHQELGFIQGDYLVETPLQPGDALAVTLGFTRLSILSDDGVVFEVSFTPDGGSQVVSILSQEVQYTDSPVTQTVPLSGIEAGQTGVFTLRVLSGDSASRDWALWIDAQLVRP